MASDTKQEQAAEAMERALNRFASRDRTEPISHADLRAIVAHIGAGPTPHWMLSLQPRHAGFDAPRFGNGELQ